MPTSGAALAISAAAMAQAEAAKTAACKALMHGFTNDTATVAQVQEYAACARRIYPAEWSPEMIIGAKVVVAILILSVIVGAVWGWFDEYSGPIEGPVMVGFQCLLLSAGTMFAIGLLYAGVMFLLS